MQHRVDMGGDPKSLTIGKSSNGATGPNRDEQRYSPVILKINISNGWSIKQNDKLRRGANQPRRSKVKRHVQGWWIQLRQVQLDLVVKRGTSEQVIEQ